MCMHTCRHRSVEGMEAGGKVHSGPQRQQKHIVQGLEVGNSGKTKTLPKRTNWRFHFKKFKT